MMDYGKKILDENQRFDRIKSIHKYRLFSIAWLTDILDDLTCLTIIQKRKSTVGGPG